MPPLSSSISYLPILTPADTKTSTTPERQSPELQPRPAYAPLPPFNPAATIPALYLHVPFCTSKCHYCDFYSIAGHLDQTDAYLAALTTEIDLQLAHFGKPKPQTIFIGGGTPTLLSPTHLNQLLYTLLSRIDTSALTEFTIEANPNTFDAPRAALCAAHGINRISFGAQSFLPHELKILQRDHDPASVSAALATARAAGITNLNIDLIFGTPGQTLADWSYSLQSALDLAPTHLSAYSLIFEPNTPMTARLHSGEFAPLDESTELAIFHHTYDTLRSAGYHRYEVSNYSLPGQECQHNLHYWKGANYLAFGPAAAAHYNGHRWKNIPSLNHYLAALAPGATGLRSSQTRAVVHASIENRKSKIENPPMTNYQLPITQMESLPPLRRAGELAMLLLRLTSGLSYAEFESLTHIDPRPRLAPILQKYRGLGFLNDAPDSLRLTDAGVPVSDHILANILAAFA